MLVMEFFLSIFMHEDNNNSNNNNNKKWHLQSNLRLVKYLYSITFEITAGRLRHMKKNLKV